jgi:hypothetical protein
MLNLVVFEVTTKHSVVKSNFESCSVNEIWYVSDISVE